jgi:hypothetical protein
MITAQFAKDQQFCDFYKRNNKGKGRKNMRCFPACCANGHVASGYCGRPVTVNTACDCDAAKGLDLLAFCEIRQHYDTSAPLDRVSLGKEYTVAEIMERSRGPDHNPGKTVLHPWFPGVVLSSSTDKPTNQVHKTFSFNYRNQGWHYAWHAQSRQSTKHELTVFILAGSKDSNYFTCVSEVSSPTFTITCRRKTRMIQEAAAAAAKKRDGTKTIKREIKPDINISVHEVLAKQHKISAVPSATAAVAPAVPAHDPAAPASIGLCYSSPIVTTRDLSTILLEHIMPSNSSAPGLAASSDVPSRALKVVKTEGKAFCATSSKAVVSSASNLDFPFELESEDHLWMDLLLNEVEEGGDLPIHCDPLSCSGLQAGRTQEGGFG